MSLQDEMKRISFQKFVKVVMILEIREAGASGSDTWYSCFDLEKGVKLSYAWKVVNLTEIRRLIKVFVGLL